LHQKLPLANRYFLTIITGAPEKASAKPVFLFGFPTTRQLPVPRLAHRSSLGDEEIGPTVLAWLPGPWRIRFSEISGI